VCCAVADGISLRFTTAREIEHSRALVALPSEGGAPAYAHRQARPHLTGRVVEIDCRQRLGMRRFTSDLP
jgi:hypothetical protein